MHRVKTKTKDITRKRKGKQQTYSGNVFWRVERTKNGPGPRSVSGSAVLSQLGSRCL